MSVSVVATDGPPRQEGILVKLKVCAFSLLLTVLPVSSAMAGDLYDNGPVHDDQPAWTINFG